MATGCCGPGWLCPSALVVARAMNHSVTLAGQWPRLLSNSLSSLMASPPIARSVGGGDRAHLASVQWMPR